MSEKLENSVLMFVLFLMGVLIICGTWLALPRLFVESAHGAGVTHFQVLQLQNEARSSLVFIFGGAAVIGVLLFPMRRFGALERAVDLALHRQGSEMFSRAVEALDRPSTNQRVGGIYALEQIARSTGGERIAALEILSSFVRDQATREGTGGGADPRVRGDVQAALSVIGRLTTPGEDLPPRAVDLRNVFAPRVDLRGARLDHVDLSGAVLDGADLSHASLASARLAGASLKGADLNHASLHRTDLRGADLTEAYSVARRQIDEALADDKTLRPGHLIEG